MKKNYRFVDMMHVFAFMSCVSFVACGEMTYLIFQSVLY